MANKHQPQNNPTSNQNTGMYNLQTIFLLIFGLVRLNYVDQSNDNIDVLCQYCNKIIRGRDYHNHTVNSPMIFYIYYFSIEQQVCVQQYYQPTIQQPQLNVIFYLTEFVSSVVLDAPTELTLLRLLDADIAIIISGSISSNHMRSESFYPFELHFEYFLIQRICKQNPLNTSLEAQLRAVYYPPPLYTTQYYYSN